MDPATAMAIVATIDIVIKYGEKLVRWCQAYRRADEALGEIVVRLENRWYRVKVQFVYLKEWSEHLPREFLRIQARTLFILKSKLELAELKVAALFPKEAPELTEKDLQDAVPKIELPAQGSKTWSLQVLSKVTAPFHHVGPHVKNSLRKAKYATHAKSLNALIESIKDWQGEFDPTWFMTLNQQQERLQALRQRSTQQSPPSGNSVTPIGGQIEETPKQITAPGYGTTSALALRPVNANLDETPTAQISFLEDPSMITSMRQRVLFSSIIVTSRKDDNQELLLDSMPFDASVDEKTITTDAQDLVHKLTHSDPLTFGLLQCCGLIKTRSDTSNADSSFDISFLFALPEHHNAPKSLRSTLVNQTKCTLNERYSLAKRLANAISFVHSAGFVHKNVRPETIILLADTDSTDDDLIADKPNLGLAFLVGFSTFRHAEGMSLLQGDDSREKNLYRHPSRQGSHPEQRYKMQHDIYSLGVCLLEIGLWRSFVNYEGQDSSDGAVFSPYFDIPSSITNIKDNRKRANATKAALVDMAETTLKFSVGEEYADIVVLCLKCLDDDGTMAETLQDGKAKDEDTKEDGTEIGVRYIQQIIQRIHMLHV